MLLYNCKRERVPEQKRRKEMLGREATTEEIKVYNKVNEIVNAMEDEEFDQFVEIISERVFDWENDKKVYNRAYRTAKKYGLTLNEAITWYCMD